MQVKLTVYETQGFVHNDYVPSVVPMNVIELLGSRIRRHEVIKYLDGREETIAQGRTYYS